MKTLLGSPFFWLAVFLLAGELIARQMLPWADAPTAAEVPRNTYFRRGWSEYLAGDEPVDVVLLGNSQSHGREIAADQIFAARLRERFAAQSSSVSLENWAVYGRTPVDLDLLLLEAARRQPRLVVYLATLSDYALGPNEYRLGFTAHDTDLLIADPRLWPGLPGTATGRLLTADAFLFRALAGNMESVRVRTWALDLLASRLHPTKYRILMGHDRETDNLQFEKFVDRSPPLAVDAGFRLPNPPSRETMNRRLAALPPLLNHMLRLVTEDNVPLLWVWQPVADELLTRDQRAEAERFYRLATLKLQNYGLTVVDLRDLVPVDYYYTVSHFDARGHALMAQTLEPLIRDAL